MNIKISIKDCECAPTTNKRMEFSEVEQKKRNMLHGPPQKDNKNTNHTKPPKHNNDKKDKEKQQRNNRNSQRYRESQKQMLNQLKKAGKNGANNDAIQNSNTIIQRQNQILQQNQRTISDMMKNNQNSNSHPNQEFKKAFNQSLDKIKEEVKEIKKMRDQMASIAQEFNRNLANQAGKGSTNHVIPQKMDNINQNFKNLVQASKNHLEGLQNMEAIKSLQNFNIQGYVQAINSIKRQIAQYQKESENIERQLRLRQAKLQKLQVPPSFQKQLLQPYEKHLSQKANSIDLHAIREKVYEKLGGFDYGKFEYNIGQIMVEAKSQLGNFSLVCNEHKINVPQIRFDAKQLKQMELKIPSVLDEYKEAKGIVFQEKKENTKNAGNKNVKNDQNLRKTHQIQETLKNTNQGMKQTDMKRIVSKPIDKSSNTRLTRMGDEPKTILTNNEQKQKKEVQAKFKKTSRQKKKEDEEFEKYLENRAREELQLIYEEKKKRLERMQRDLHDYCEEPTYINLNLTKEDVKKKSDRQPIKKEQKMEEDEYAEQFDDYEKEEEKKEKKKQEEIKEMGRDILKDKLKQILKNKGKQPPLPSRNQGQMNQGIQMQNMAEGVINLINNTLTQVNSNISTTIERRMKSTEERKPSFERRSPKKLQIPKLQEFRAPPIYTMGIAINNRQQIERQTEKKQKKKIELKNYEHLNVRDENQNESESELDDLRISDYNE